MARNLTFILILLSLVILSATAKRQETVKLRINEFFQIDVGFSFNEEYDRPLMADLEKAVASIKPHMGLMIKELDGWLVENGKTKTNKYYLKQGIEYLQLYARIKNALDNVLYGDLESLRPRFNWHQDMCVGSACFTGVNFDIVYIPEHGVRFSASVHHIFTFEFIPVVVGYTASLTVGQKSKVGVGVDAYVPMIKTGVKAHASVGHDGINLHAEAEILGAGVGANINASWQGLQVNVAVRVPFIGTFAFYFWFRNPFASSHSLRLR